MRVSKLGVALCVLYIAPALWCVLTGLNASDPKSRFVLFQLPIVFQEAAVGWLGGRTWLRSLSWAQAYIVLATPVVLALYLIGHLLGRVLCRVWKIQQTR
jgi:hypothetical protein